MKKQEILAEYYKLLKIENYSIQTVKSYYSALKLFLDWITQSRLQEVTDIRYIQELLGHKSLETTQIYTHVSS